MWQTLNGEIIHSEIKNEVEDILTQEKSLGNNIRVCIGTDSQAHKNYVDFATVIVFVRAKRGGFMLIDKDRVYERMTVKERMIREVAKSVEIAYSLCNVLDRHQVGLEVHADINTNPRFKSHKALSEAMGYIKSMGYEFKAKPDAFASSSCADRFVN